MIDCHYVYIHKTATTGEVFYVGKGTKFTGKGYARGFEIKRRSKFWESVASKYGVVVEIVSDFDDEVRAFDLERELISIHGRRDIGTGTLVNMTNGGEGMSGHRQSKETIEKKRKSMIGKHTPDHVRKKISDSLSGERHPFYGKSRSEETRRRQSMSGKGIRLGGKSPVAKAVIDTSTGRVFPSTRDAAEFLGIAMCTLSHKLSGIRPNNTSFRYA